MEQTNFGCRFSQKACETMLFLIGKFFGLRGGREQRQLEWDNEIKLTQTEFGEALIYKNHFRRNYRGGLKQRNVKPKIIKAFKNPSDPEKCIVHIYKLYATKRPSNGKCNSCYLQPLVNYCDFKHIRRS